MEKESSCVAVFAKLEHANDAIQQLLVANVDKNHISLIGEKIQQGKIATADLDNLDNDLFQLGVHKANLYCYKCLIYSGYYLVIISGNYKEVEHACNQLEENEQADAAIHFNTR